MMTTNCIVVIISVMFLMAAQEFGGTVMMTISIKLVIYQKGFIVKRLTNSQKKMSGSTDVFFVFCIRTSHLIKHSSNFFQEFTTMSKITHMKQVIEDQYVFRSEFQFRQEVNDGIQTSISYIKYELQNSIEKNIRGK